MKIMNLNINWSCEYFPGNKVKPDVFRSWRYRHNRMSLDTSRAQNTPDGSGSDLQPSTSDDLTSCDVFPGRRRWTWDRWEGKRRHWSETCSGSSFCLCRFLSGVRILLEGEGASPIRDKHHQDRKHRDRRGRGYWGHERKTSGWVNTHPLISELNDTRDYGFHRKHSVWEEKHRESECVHTHTIVTIWRQTWSSQIFFLWLVHSTPLGLRTLKWIIDQIQILNQTIKTFIL